MNARNSGQALLLILLSVGVIITVALSVVAKSVTDLGSTKKDEQSLRAFSAAEAGVEENLKTQVVSIPTNSSGNVGSSGSYVTTSTGFPENTAQYLYPSELLSGDVATVWLSSHTGAVSLGCGGSNVCYTATTLNLCWGKPGATVQPAIVATIVYADATGTIKSATAAFDNSNSRAQSNHFTSSGISASCTVNGTDLAYRTVLRFSDYGINVANSTLKAMVLRVLYNSAEPTLVGVTAASGNFPLQGKRIESTGAAGDSSRKVQVYALYPEVPNIFQGALYSPPGVAKN